MTREEAIKIMQLNKGRMNGSVQAAPKATPCCLNCGEKEKCSREDKRWGGPCEAYRMEGQDNG